MTVETMPDDRLTLFYENIRRQVEADRMYKHSFMGGEAVRQYAESLRSEMVKRRLSHAPIEWPPSGE